MPRRKKSDPHSKFYSVIASHRFKAEDEEGEGAEFAPGHEGPEDEEETRSRGGNRRSKSDPGRSPREEFSIFLADAHEKAMRNPAASARDAAYYRFRASRGLQPGEPGPPVAEIDREWQTPRVTKTDTYLIKRGERENTWRKSPNVYRVPSKDKKTAGEFLSQEAAPSHRRHINEQLRNPTSPFNANLDPNKAKTGKLTSGQRRRLTLYTDTLQQGFTHDEAMERVRRSVTREGVGRPAARQARQSQARQAVSGPRPAGRESKYKSVAPTPNEFRFGIDASSIPKVADLKKQFPNANDQEIIKIQQSAAELITQDLVANQKWGHETRRANLLGKQSSRKENPDKVTIFTTNIGHPTVSVPSDSLVGQYIIKKRKAVLGGYGVPSSQLKGEFPDAVRDAHIIDVATGVSVGLQGRQGVFNTTGYRFGKKASPGYGKPKPLGSHILYDTSSGRPLYDAQGNIRYSDGATRPIDYTTGNIGARILIG